MHRLLAESAELEREAPALSREAANHLRVLRPKDGEEIELFDGKGSWRVFRYDASTRALGKPVSDRCLLAAANRPLTLFACITKGSRWDWTIEKATELGVTRIVPVLSGRTIVRIGVSERAAKRERWQRVAEEAARQSDAKWLPEVLEAVDFADSLDLVRECDCVVGALTDPPPPTIGEMSGGDALYVGPEGDFTPEELKTLLAVARPASFGSTILRAETAAIYGLSVLKARIDANVRAG